MKKILFILILVFGFCFDIKVFAAEIIVDGIIYDANYDFSGNGYSFNSAKKALYLDNYNGGIIEYTEKQLTISVNNNNYINGTGSEVALKVLNANIYGSGSLNIFNSDIGILGECFQVNSTNILIMAKEYGIKVTNDQVYLNNTKISIKNSEIGILGTLSFFLQNTTLNITNCNYGIKGNNLEVSLVDSNLYIDTNDYCLFDVNNIRVVNSKAIFRSKLTALKDKYIMSRLGNVIYAGDQEGNYFKDAEYHNYSIVKVAHSDYINDLLVNESSLILNFDESFIKNDSEVENDDELNSDNKNDNEVENDNELNSDNKNDNEVENDNELNSDNKNDNEVENNDELNSDTKNNEDDNSQNNDSSHNSDQIDNENDKNNVNSGNNKNNVNNSLDVLTKNEYNENIYTNGEYTKNEYIDSEFDSIEIVNPNTYDNLNSFIIIGFISIFVIISILFFRSENE